jgi:Uma2 family endonuclease
MTVAPLPNFAAPRDQRFVLDGVDWTTYESMLRSLGDRHLFLTYDRGRLELMSPSFKHDDLGRLLGLLIHILADETDLPLKGCGSTTFRRRDLDRGLEPDECFYVANEARIRGKEEIDLSTDPPPDLAVEVEISRRLLDRVEIYAALGVPELWRHDGERLSVFRLDPAGKYQPCDRSPTFPAMPLDKVDALLKDARNLDEVKWARTARTWIRENVARPDRAV